MKFKEECGVFGGVSTQNNIPKIIYNGLCSLQHRGQDSAGMCFLENNNLELIKSKGLVEKVFYNKKLDKYSSSIGIGHVRYSTTGKNNTKNAQPIVNIINNESIAIAHNGNCHNVSKIKNDLKKKNVIFNTDSDTEIILKALIQNIKKPPSYWTIDEIANVLKSKFKNCAWSLLIMLPNKIIGLRDENGYRPLMMAKCSEGIFLASEDCAFSFLNNPEITEIKSGQGVEITKDNVCIKEFSKAQKEKKCVFEQIYFSKPSSNIFGKNVYASRIELGKQCARENKLKADMVIPVINSGLTSAIGYSQELGIPIVMGLEENNIDTRSFIQPNNDERKEKALNKLVPIKNLVKGKNIILVDDSIVRGTTSKILIKSLKEAGVKQIHFVSSAPAIINTCYWGVDIPHKNELIAAKFKSNTELAKEIYADSVSFLSVDGLKQVFSKNGWCFHCLKN